ncbi:MAG TPA: biotin/lipoyl-binding protein, partial [bacterium]|nr:biotin/lipoyl-binding protein [bacterium]
MAEDVDLRALRPRVRTRRLVLIAGSALALLLIIAGIRYWQLNAGLVKTDNAQTAGDLAPISSRIPGTVSKVSVNENDFVKAGTVLVELDP